MSSHSCSHSASTSTTTPSANGGGETPFTAIPAEIIDAHILIKLDGPTLASAACVSTTLNALCANETLWMNICNTTWPSITHPLVRDAISTFPSGYRSFFSNSFPSLKSHHHYTGEDLDRDRDHDHQAATTQLISAVDIWYKNKIVFSKISVLDMHTLSELFFNLPIGIDAIHIMRDKGVKFPIIEEEEAEEDDDKLLSHVAEQLTLSWILIDPTRKRAANFSSIQPVSVEPMFVNNFRQIRYSTLIVGGSEPSSEPVKFQISVTCGIGCEGMETKRWELVVREVYFQMFNKEGTWLTGKDGLVYLQRAMAMVCDSKSGRKKRGNVFEEYLKIKKEREEKKAEGIELNVGDHACIFALTIVVTGWWICICFLNYILIKKRKFADYVSKKWR